MNIEITIKETDVVKHGDKSETVTVVKEFGFKTPTRSCEAAVEGVMNVLATQLSEVLLASIAELNAQREEAMARLTKEDKLLPSAPAHDPQMTLKLEIPKPAVLVPEVLKPE